MAFHKLLLCNGSIPQPTTHHQAMHAAPCCLDTVLEEKVAGLFMADIVQVQGLAQLTSRS